MYHLQIKYRSRTILCSSKSVGRRKSAVGKAFERNKRTSGYDCKMIHLLTISIWLLFIAVIPIIPYPFYLLLRLIVSISCFYAYFKTRHIYYRYSWTRPALLYIGILFNPIFPVHLIRIIWTPIDIICGLVLIKVRKEIVIFKDLIDEKWSCDKQV